MDQNVLEKVTSLMQKTADELHLELVRVSFLPHGENGPTLEVFIDHDLAITLEEIQRFTDIVSPQLDEIEGLDETYMLDISSGGSEKELTPKDLPLLVGKYLDLTFKESGEKLVAKLVSVEDDGLTLLYFLKGRKKQVHCSCDAFSSIRVGYKA